VDTTILVRHAESEASARAAVSSDPARPCPLTQLGREQARALARELAGEVIDLCVVTEIQRTRETAELALAGRRIPFVIVPELNDPRAGSFEGGPLEDFRDWAWSHGSKDEPPGGGETRLFLAARLARGYRAVLEGPEAKVLVVGHALPMAYVLVGPSPRVDLIEYATPYRLPRAKLEAAVKRLETWVAAPTW